MTSLSSEPMPECTPVDIECPIDPLEAKRIKQREANRRYREKNPDKVRESVRAWREKNLDKTKEYDRNRYAADPVEARAQTKRYREKNPEKARESANAWKARNREKLAAYRKAYREKNRDREDASTKAWRAANRERVSENMRSWREVNSERVASYKGDGSIERFRQLKAKYGVTQDAYSEMLVAQGYRCTLCGTEHTEEKKLHVDHCHASGKVRGLLCNNCNRGIGHLKENIVTMKNAISYLMKHKE